MILSMPLATQEVSSLPDSERRDKLAEACEAHPAQPT